MKFELEKYHRNIPDAELINDLRATAEKIGKNSVTQKEYDLHGKFDSNTISRRFKSWFVALERAGLEKTRADFNIPNLELFSNLADVWTKLARQPRRSEIKAPLSKYSSSTYEQRFGSWRKALESFVTSMGNQEETDSRSSGTAISEPMELTGKRSQKKTSREISLRLRFSVLLRDGFKCQACGKSPLTNPGTELHVDHIVPWSKGGETTLDNLRALCSDCNLGKGNSDG